MNSFELLSLEDLMSVSGGSDTTHSWGVAIGEFLRGLYDAF